MTSALHGLGVAGSRPVAIGHAFLLSDDPMVVKQSIDGGQIDAELRRLDGALASARRHLEGVRAQVSPSTPLQIAELFDAQMMMLADAALVDATRELIREQRVNAGWALKLQRDALVEVFEAMDDPYLRARGDDVDHVVRQIQVFLSGQTPQVALSQRDLADHIIVARDLTPADAILLRHRGVAAFITEHGGPMSHTAILARSLDIPILLGVRGATQILRQHELLVVDAAAGSVLADVDERTLAHYRARVDSADRHRRELRRLLKEPSTSGDGEPVILLANLELPEDVAAACFNGALGVGLYRTEFLYMNRDTLPDEEEHLGTYLEIIQGLDGIPLTIRTLDLGLDKQAEHLVAGVGNQVNPALGLRAIRLCLKHPELFLPQVRAILRASAAGPVRLMLPLLTSVDEVDAALEMIAAVRRDLRRDGLAFDPLMPIGGMIEVPAAALAAGALARRLDFLSIGTNDLIQYTLAIDRGDDEVSYLYDPLHPAILRLILFTLQAAAKTRTRVSMCGEMAGDPRCTRLLLALGLRELSMHPNALLEVKQVVRRCDIGAMERALAPMLDDLDEVPPETLLDTLAACDRT
jgi:phosphotransferase system enzyme I (PtsI)